MKYTKAPWSNTGLEIRAQNSTIIATVYSHLPNNQSREEAEANAKLIAAAPAMLELLIRIEKSLMTPDYIRELCQPVIKQATE